MRINKSLIAYTPTTGAGSGTVTSVALTAPTGFTVTGSPITSSGTLAIAFTTGYGIPPLMTGNSGKFLTTNGTTMSWVNIAGTDVTGAALTEVDDTNVTMTLGGTPSTALLRSVSITLGWAGQLAVSRGGTGAATLTGVIIGNGTSAVTAVVGTAGQYLRRNLANTAYEFRTLQGGDIAGSELTKTDDTNVTLSLSGTPASALLQPVNITLGWTGTLAVSRGGIGVGTITGVMIGNGTSAVTGVTGTANQILRRNAGNTAYEFWSANYMTNPMTLEGSIIYATTGGTPAELFANSTSTRKYLSQINGGAPTWEALSFPTGSGTTNYVAKWSSSTVLTNSQIIDNGTNVGVGISPLYKLDINGAIGLFNTILAFRTGGYTLLYDESSVVTMRFGDSSNQVNNYENTTHYIKNRGGGVTFATINSTGLGIGIAPSYKLDVNGTIGISGTQFAYRSGNYHVIFDAQGSDALTLGNASAPVNAYDNTSHLFRSRGGGTNFTTIASSGIVINAGNLQLSSAYNITWGGVYGTDIPTISGTSGGGTNGFLQFYPAGSTSGVKMALLRTGQLALPSYTTSTSFSGTAVATLAVTNAGDVITIAPSQTTASGTYTPTWTGLANVGSVTAFSCQYMRVGDTVTVSGWVTIDAVADNTPTSLSFSLPINSNTTSVNYLNGTGVQQGGGAAASLSGYGANYGEFEVSPLVDTAVNYSFHFTYRII
jgi:hypothetical protein